MHGTNRPQKSFQYISATGNRSTANDDDDDDGDSSMFKLAAIAILLYRIYSIVKWLLVNGNQANWLTAKPQNLLIMAKMEDKAKG